MVLALRDIYKTYSTSEGPLQVLSGASLTLEGGQTMALTGESGSGKSTLLHIAGALDQADSGAVLIDHQTVTTGAGRGLDDAGLARLRRFHVGLVFQAFNLIPSLSVAANLSFHARLAGRYDAERVKILADALGLHNLLERYPEQLSGGQQQRVAIGRTLAAQPKLILADEPTGNLDEKTGDHVMELMLELIKSSGAALLMVTHSPRLAKRLGAHVHLQGGRISA